VEGTVEEIGFRTTRIRTFPTTLVSIPNKTVADSAIDNLSRMPSRRVLQTVGVTYETTADQMEECVAAVREIVEGDPGVDKEKQVVVRFQDFGGSSLDILVLYFTTAIPLADHLETKERINLAIMRKVADLGLSIALPTRTLYLEGDIAKAIAGLRG
jgi:MscS family membrane protein